jgi:hypothetical protein
MRWARTLVLSLVLGCHARPLGVAHADAPTFEPEPKITQSDEPFIANPRFCLPEVAFIGDECAVQPTPC